MTVALLHLSHTDIRYDSRILKELDAIKELGNVELCAIGLESNSNSARKSGVGLNASVSAIRLVTKNLTFIPRVMRHLLNMLEMMLRMLSSGLRLRPQVVHCHDTKVLLIGFILKLLTNCKLVYDAHELESDKNGQPPLLSKIIFWIEKLCWNKVDLLISVSPSILHWYEQKLGNKNNALILNSPQMLTRSKGIEIQSKREYFHEKYNIPNSSLVFVYLGGFCNGRGIDIYLKAFSSKNVKSHVVFVGYGEMESLIASFEDKYENIHLHPAVPHEQVVDLVRAADVGLCLIENISLSDYYSLPNKLFEYAFAGLPVLASKFPDIEEIVNQYGLGRCCDVNQESMELALLKLESDYLFKIDVDLAELGWQQQGKRLRQEYKKIINSTP